jgi:hypothetical protein
MKKLICLTTVFLLSMVLVVSAKPLSTKLESVATVTVDGSDSGNVTPGFWWAKNYNVNGGWGFSIINYSSVPVSLVINAGGTDVVNEYVAAGSTKAFGGTCYGTLKIDVQHTTSTAILDFYYAVSYY